MRGRRNRAGKTGAEGSATETQSGAKALPRVALASAIRVAENLGTANVTGMLGAADPGAAMRVRTQGLRRKGTVAASTFELGSPLGSPPGSGRR